LTPPTDLPTPDSIARHLVQAAGPTTELSVGKNVSVAGHDAYQLTLAPKHDGSLIASVDVAVDAATWLPLRVRVWSTVQDKPALEAGFTELDYTTPAASVFDFNPPDLAAVEQVTMPGDGDRPASANAPKDEAMDSAEHVGLGLDLLVDAGWASVAELPLGDLMAGESVTQDMAAMPAPSDGDLLGEETYHAGSAPDAGALADLVGQLGQATDTGTVYSTALFSVLVTDSGRVLAGAVPAATLVALAG
jgi:hypothetical protein